MSYKVTPRTYFNYHMFCPYGGYQIMTSRTEQFLNSPLKTILYSADQ